MRGASGSILAATVTSRLLCTGKELFVVSLWLLHCTANGTPDCEMMRHQFSLAAGSWLHVHLQPAHPPHVGWVRGLIICQAVVVVCLNMLTPLLWHCSADQGSEQPRAVPQRTQEVWPAGQACGADAVQHCAIARPSALRGEHRGGLCVAAGVEANAVPASAWRSCSFAVHCWCPLACPPLTCPTSSVHHWRQSTRLALMVHDCQLQL